MRSIIGTVVFIAASALGGFAVNPEMLVGARVLQGIGAALAAPSTLVLLMANTVPGAQRNRAMALFVLAAGSGGAIGLILGGVLTTSFGWEWVMFVNVPIGVVIVAGALAFLRETERSHARLDFGGAVTSTLAMVALVYGFTVAAESGWLDPRTIAAFVVAAASVIALVLIERRHASPVVQLRYFRDAAHRRAVLGDALRARRPCSGSSTSPRCSRRTCSATTRSAPASRSCRSSAACSS